MKYNILGFDQVTLSRWGLGPKDAFILRWFVDFLATGKMVPVETPQGTFYWVKYQAIIDDLPILKITNRKTIAARFRKMSKVGLFKSFLLKNEDGTFSTFMLVESKYEELFPRVREASETASDAPDTPTPLHPKPYTKDSSIKKTILQNDDEESISSPSAHKKQTDESEHQVNKKSNTPKKKNEEFHENNVPSGGHSLEYQAAIDALVMAYNRAAHEAQYPAASIVNIKTFYSKVTLNTDLLPKLVAHMDQWFKWTGPNGHSEDLGDRSISMLAFNQKPFFDYVNELPTEEEILESKKEIFVMQTIFWTRQDIRNRLRSAPNLRWTEEALCFVQGDYEVDLERKEIIMGNGTVVTKDNADKVISAEWIDKDTSDKPNNESSTHKDKAAPDWTRVVGSGRP
jgi:hypothetical protein